MSMVVSRPLSNAPLLIVMGASGCGKSSVGKALAKHYNIPFIEGDRLHPQSNIAKMSSGSPLNDEDRWPWLDTIAQALSKHAAAGGGAVASCSALKRIYRERLQATCGQNLRFVFLDCSRQTLERNQAKRKGHFMPTALLDSQLATLEPPFAEASALIIDGNQRFSDVKNSIITLLEKSADHEQR